ncbi:hypothetical protein SAMN05660337_0261 [Maridesulfovibrio ferrireducens]|uniref:Uncharacterized protein n=1 Tax=Maridesulfovibrio ferrireducens TaxID=246191 RepID=A0A1G9BDX9_9BACT|nr:hypothetical protein SAMN05660337_0261 [Maridesulfovibrio ferrireducens]
MNIPSIKEFIKSKKVVLAVIAGVIALIAIIFCVITVQNNFAEERARIAEQNRIEQERILTELQNKAREKVVFSMKRLIETGHAETALTVAEKNKDLMNDELQALIHLATEKDLLFRIENTSKWNYSELAKYYSQLASLEPENSRYIKELKGYDRKLQRKLERKLYARAQTLPMRDYKANMDIYAELMQLNPGEGLYQSKYDRYKSMYDAFMKDLEKFGEKPERTSGDGYYIEVKKYLKENSEFPETLQMERCTDCYFTDNGWLVGCNYSEQNEIGSRISEFLWFTISNSTVQKVEASGAYTVN